MARNHVVETEARVAYFLWRSEPRDMNGLLHVAYVGSLTSHYVVDVILVVF